MALSHRCSDPGGVPRIVQGPGPLWAPLGPYGPGPNGPLIYIYIYIYIYVGKTLIRTGDSKGKPMKKQVGTKKKKKGAHKGTAKGNKRQENERDGKS